MLADTFHTDASTVQANLEDAIKAGELAGWLGGDHGKTYYVSPVGERLLDAINAATRDRDHEGTTS